MKLKQTLTHLLYLSLLIIGIVLPPVWLFLLYLVSLEKDLDTKKHNHNIPTSKVDYTPIPVEFNSNPIQSKREYMKSQEWNTRRLAVLKRDQYTCQLCSIDSVPLDVHHITYANLGSEPLTDLVALCRHCHDSIHDKHGYDYNSTFPVKG